MGEGRAMAQKAAQTTQKAVSKTVPSAQAGTPQDDGEQSFQLHYRTRDSSYGQTVQSLCDYAGIKCDVRMTRQDIDVPGFNSDFGSISGFTVSWYVFDINGVGAVASLSKFSTAYDKTFNGGGGVRSQHSTLGARRES